MQGLLTSIVAFQNGEFILGLEEFVIGFLGLHSQSGVVPGHVLELSLLVFDHDLHFPEVLLKVLVVLKIGLFFVKGDLVSLAHIVPVHTDLFLGLIQFLMDLIQLHVDLFKVDFEISQAVFEVGDFLGFGFDFFPKTLDVTFSFLDDRVEDLDFGLLFVAVGVSLCDISVLFLDFSVEILDLFCSLLKGGSHLI